jgi:hypothetical protein
MGRRCTPSRLSTAPLPSRRNVRARFRHLHANAASRHSCKAIRRARSLLQARHCRKRKERHDLRTTKQRGAPQCGAPCRLQLSQCPKASACVIYLSMQRCESQHAQRCPTLRPTSCRPFLRRWSLNLALAAAAEEEEAELEFRVVGPAWFSPLLI